METAREESRRMRLETEDYCDQKLKNFESTLGQARDVIATGRRKLQETETERNQEIGASEVSNLDGGGSSDSGSTSSTALFDWDSALGDDGF